MGASTEATRAVREAAFDSMVWEDQATDVVATNGLPTLSTDGVSVAGRSAFAIQVKATAGTLAATVRVHGYANGAWGLIPSSSYDVDAANLLEATPVGGACERVYLEVSAYTSGTITLAVGVPKP